MKRSRKSIILTLSILCLCVIFCSSCSKKKDGEETTSNKEEQTSTDGDTADDGAVAEFDSWDGVHIKSTSNRDGDAVISGEGVSIVYDEDKASNVLTMEGKGFLELPGDIFEEITDGFTVALDVKLAEDCGAGANIFQFNPCGYGVGDTFWRDAPEISVKADLLTTFYVGGRTIDGVFNALATYNNGGSGDDLAYAEPGGHKTRYTATAGSSLSDEAWSRILLSVSSQQYALYVDGTKVDMTDTTADSDIESSLEYLFSDGILQTYLLNSIGNSVYSDVDNFSGRIDNITIYDCTLSGDETGAEPFLCWDFSNDTLVAGGDESYVSDLTTYLDGTSLQDVAEACLESPDGKLSILVKTDDHGRYYIASVYGGSVITEASLVGLLLEEADLTEGLELEADHIGTDSVNETFSLLTGSSSEAENNYNAITLPFTKDNASFTLEIRAYNDGFAYKYENVMVEGAEDLTVMDEVSEYILSDRAVTWAFQLNGTYEGEYAKRTNSQLEAASMLFSTPLLAEIDGCYVLFSEGGVYNNDGEYCSSGLLTNAGSKQLIWSFGLARDPSKESTGDLDSPGHISITEVETVNGFSTPWRAAVISDDVNAFCTSNLIACLNDAPDETLYADTSYILPGKVAWSWWAEDSSQGDYDKHVEYIDFAAENGWDYVCLDVGWRSFEDRLEELCAYAKNKGVGIFVWINYRDMKEEADMDALFSKWASAGAAGLKTDYFESDEASVLYNMQLVAETAAKYQLMVLYHGCVRPAGEYRTYPNVLTMEAVQGEEWHKWFDYPTTENCLLYPFTRNVLGSMDYTPAGLPTSNGETAGFAIAKTVVYQSALQHFASAASVYRKFNGLSLLNHIPTTWDDTTVLEGAAGEYISLMRQSGDEYYLGAMTVEARTATFPLDFLGEGTYTAYIYEDNEEGSGLTVRSVNVSSGDELSFELLNDGGVAVMITKEEINLDCYDDSDNDNENYTYYEAESSSNTLNGTAVIATASLCSGGKKVGYVGYGAGNTLTFNKVTVDAEGDYEVILYYCSGEDRKTEVVVNDSESMELTGLNSGSYDQYSSVSFTVHLNAGENTITFGNSSYYAPDFDRIAVSKTAQ